MEQNYRFTIAYDGSRYFGWQRQPDKDTIQGRIEAVIKIMCDKDVELIGAGRTDAGVHAKGMVANAVMDVEMGTQDICDYLNRYLPDDISIIEVSKASDRFHARYNATGKTYCYTCYDGSAKPVFQRKYVYRLIENPDVDAMRDAAGILLGTHDFKNFSMNPHMKKSTVRTVDSIEITKKSGFINFVFHGDGFLQNMVRIMVGTLLEVGCGRMDAARVKEALDSDERMKAGPTAPAKGLCLINVDYN